MQILSWNIRGLGSRLKKRFASKIIRSKKPDIILFQESKLEKLERGTAIRIWGDAEMDYVIAESEGASGGLITMWNKKSFRAQHLLARKNFIIVKGTLLGNFECILINVYAPNEIRNRREL